MYRVGFTGNKKKAVQGETGRRAGSCARMDTGFLMRSVKETGYHFSGITGFFWGDYRFFHHFHLFRHSLVHEGTYPGTGGMLGGSGPERFKAFLFSIF